jgi:hypothetical protein
MPDTPTIIRGVQTDYKHLFYSEELAALRVPVTLQSGYGVLVAGTILAKNKSNLTTGGKDQLVPYNPTSFTGAEDHPGRAFLVADSGTTASTLKVTINDSYKFKVGDDVIINDNTTTAENLGAITAIDRTTYTNYAVITVTTATGGTSFTTARFAHIFVEAGDNTNNYSDAVGILQKSVDTGTGVNAKGALGVLILGNCVVYEGLLTNCDSAAKTDISGTSFGQFLYIR